MGKEVVRDAGSVSWLSGQTGPAGTGRRKANVISAAGEEGMGWGGMGWDGREGGMYHAAGS